MESQKVAAIRAQLDALSDAFDAAQAGLSSAKAENVKLKEELAACKVDSYIQGRKDMQDEIIDKLGSYEANKCAQIAASIDAARKEQPLSEELGGY